MPRVDWKGDDFDNIERSEIDREYQRKVENKRHAKFRKGLSNDTRKRGKVRRGGKFDDLLM